MAIFTTTFLYTLTPGGTNQFTVNGEIANGQASIDAGDDTISVNETVPVDFTTQNTLDGDFIYLGREPGLPGAVGQRISDGTYYLFSNDAVPLNQNFNIQAVVVVSPLDAFTVSLYTDDTLGTFVNGLTGSTAFADALAAATAGQAISVDDPGALGDVGAQSVTVDALTIIANGPFDASLSLTGGAHDLTLAGTSDIDVLGSAAGGKITGNDGNNQLTGQGGDDVLAGGAGNDTLDGGAGTDLLNGLTGADSMTGGTGDDRYYVDDAGDQVIEALGAGGGTDEVFAYINYTLGANIENLRGRLDSGLVLSGNGLGNKVTGGGGNDTLSGGGGLDTLSGGAGGSDTFLFDTALVAGEITTMVGFAAGDDKIALSGSVFDQAGGAGALSTDAFVIGAAAQDAGDRIIYNSASGALFYDSDGTGSAVATQFAKVSKGLALSAGDFTIV